jgi:uncharacterized protein YjbI with pentapeptide repeats
MAGFSFAVALMFAKAAVVARPVTDESCAARMGVIGGPAPTLPVAVAGTSLRKVDAIEKLRKKDKSGAMILIDGGDFSGWNFTKSRLSNICFRGAKMVGSDWRGVSAAGLGFVDTDLTGALFQGSVLPGVLFRTATLAKVDATNADFRGGRLDGGWSASLAALKIDGANFGNFRFACGVTETDGCAFDRQGISAQGTDFSGARFDNFALWGATLTGARFNGADMAADDVGQVAGATVPTLIVVRSGWRTIEVPGTTIPALSRILATSAAASATPPTAPTTTPARPPRPTALAEGGYLFIRSDMTIPANGAADPAWPRVVAILTRLSPAYLLARVGTDRRISLRGKASASASAACTIETPALSFSAGSYAMTPTVTPAGRRRATAGPPIPVVRFVGDVATLDSAQDSTPGMVRIPRCTGAAPFGPMKMVPVDDLTFEALWSAAGPVAL